MKLTEMTCPSCGADLKLDADCAKAVCEYCGSSVLIDDGAEFRDAEREGYAFERGRQRAMAEYAPPRRRLIWLWVLGWIFIFPVPVTILVSRSKLPSWAKTLITVAVWGAFLAIGLYGGEKEPQEPRPSPAPTSVSDSSFVG